MGARRCGNIVQPAKYINNTNEKSTKFCDSSDVSDQLTNIKCRVHLETPKIPASAN
jgi:hypothetical protein